jgi:outer membrane protein assembly factor BamB
MDAKWLNVAVSWAGRAVSARNLMLILTALAAGRPCSAGGQTVVASAKAEVAESQPSTPASDWPCWRGAAGDNHSASRHPPVEWSATQNVLWKIDVPGLGHSSPTIVGNKIFLASADEQTETQFLVCLDRQTGQELWTTNLHHGHLPPKHEKNSHASATPACDGESVYVLMANAGQLWASAVATDGHVIWQKSLGGFQHANGYGSSPALYGHLVIAANDNELDPGLTALDRTDGHVVWHITRPSSDNSATPLVATVAGRPQLLINGANAVNSYDPATGAELWHVTHTTGVAACTMAFDDQCVFASGNVPDKLMLAVRADGQGDVTDTHILWSTHEANTYVPSPLVSGKFLFAVIDGGTAYCRDTRSGEVIWKHRLGGTFFASPVAAGDYIYATNDAGVTYVFRPTEAFELVAQNEVGQTCFATPVILEDRLYLRTTSSLFCIGHDSP